MMSYKSRFNKNTSHSQSTSIISKAQFWLAYLGQIINSFRVLVLVLFYTFYFVWKSISQ